MPIITTTVEVARALADARRAIEGIRSGIEFFRQRAIGKAEVEALLDAAEAENRDITDDELKELLDSVQANLDALNAEIEARDAAITSEERAAISEFESDGPDT